jgi:PAS domain S-box-containing protein
MASEPAGEAPGAAVAWPKPRVLAQIRSYLPEGRELPEQQWRARHRAILWVIAAHAVGLAAFGLAQGWGYAYALGEGALIGFLGVVAGWPRLGRRFRSSTAALALVTSSAVLVQFWGGYIEGHFHYFVVVAVVSLYQDWVPFLLAILYVAVDHGAIGTLEPAWVYKNSDAVAHPWEWATIHAAFVLAECTALLAAWRASEAARAHAELVLRSTGEGLVGIGLDGRITFANPAAAELTGRHPGSLVGAPARTILPGVATAGNGLTAAPGSQAGAHATEGSLLRGDGASVPVELVTTPILHNGTVQGSVVAVKDITERKRAEREHAESLQRQVEILRLKEQDAFKTLFINTAAHELRTPMTPIKIHIHVLQGGKHGELNHEQQRVVGILKRNLDRLGQLIEDVLSVSRLQAGRLAIQAKPVAIDALVREAVESFQEVAERNQVELRLLDKANVQVQGDTKRLGQVMLNLLDNAFKFTPSGGRVDVGARVQDGVVEVRVKDTGTGLSPENLQRLFQPFSQAHDPMERTRSGSGLGLYICKGFVELHGGTIRCESEGPGRGSTFLFTLPLAGRAPGANGGQSPPQDRIRDTSVRGMDAP